jgi:predicted PurR-regulated permease PerM
MSRPSPATLVKAVDAGERPGAATAATHRVLWGALAAAVAWPVLGACGVEHAQVAAVGVGLLTVLPWLGPLLGVLFAAVLAALVPQPYAPLLGLAAAALITLAAAPATHPPGWLGPLSIPATSAAAVLGGAVWGVFGALLALVLTSIAAHIRHRSGGKRHDFSPDRV